MSPRGKESLRRRSHGVFVRATRSLLAAGRASVRHTEVGSVRLYQSPLDKPPRFYDAYTNCAPASSLSVTVDFTWINESRIKHSLEGHKASGIIARKFRMGSDFRTLQLQNQLMWRLGSNVQSFSIGGCGLPVLSNSRTRLP